MPFINDRSCCKVECCLPADKLPIILEKCKTIIQLGKWLIYVVIPWQGFIQDKTDWFYDHSMHFSWTWLSSFITGSSFVKFYYQALTRIHTMNLGLEYQLQLWPLLSVSTKTIVTSRMVANADYVHPLIHACATFFPRLAFLIWTPDFPGGRNLCRNIIGWT